MNSDRPPSSTVRDMPRCRALGAPARRAAASRSASPSVPSSRPSSWTTSVGSGGAPAPGSCWPNSAGGESAGSGVTTAAPCPPAPERLDRGGHRGRRHGRLDQHVDRAAAGQPDVPRLLVADPVADDPGVAVGAGLLDLLGRGALDAAAADRARDPAIARRTAGPRPRVAARSRTCARRRRGRRRSPSPCQAASVSSSSFIGWASPSRGRPAWPPTDRRRRGAGRRRGLGRLGTPGSAAWAAASLPRRVSAERTPPRISPSRSSEATVPAGRKSSMYG